MSITKLFGDVAGADYPGTQDTYLDSAAPTANNGTNVFINTAAASNNLLLRFTRLLTAIPAGSVVTAATLTLDQTGCSAGGGAGNVKVYPCNRAWTEAGATWNTIDGATAWTAAGGDNATDHGSSAYVASLANYVNLVASGAGLVAAIQAMVNSRVNNGFMVTRDVGYQIYNSGNSATPAYRPQLSVTWSPPGGPGTGFKKLLLALGYFSVLAMAIPAYIKGADIGGWKTYTPVTTNGTDNATRSNYTTMTGSRLHYVDPSQTVATTMLALDQAATWNASTNPHGGPYLWNGTAIIDMSGNTAPLTGPYTGVAYGTDPMNPSAAVQAFKRVSYVSLNRFGTNRLNGTLMTGDYTSAGTSTHDVGVGRNGKPDWTLIKRGTTLLMEDDFYDLCVEGNAAILKNDMYGSLAVPGGTSLTAMNIVGAYGPLKDARPRITKTPQFGFFDKDGTVKAIEYTALVSLHFDGSQRAHYTNSRVPMYLHDTTGVATNFNVWCEDMLFDRLDGSVLIQNNNTFNTDFFRCCFFDAWGASAGAAFEANSGLSQVNYHQCILTRNGKTSDPTVPANNGGADTIFSRNIYQSGEASKDGIIDGCLFLAGGSGEQFRAGKILKDTYFLTSGTALAAQGGAAYATSQINTGAVQNCVFERYYQAITGGAAGLGVFFGPHDVDISGSVVTDAGMAPADRATYSANGSGGFSVGGHAGGWYHDVLAPTQNNRFHNNVIINRGGDVSLRTEEGVRNADISGLNDLVSGSGFVSWSQAAGPVYATTLTAAVAAGSAVIPVASVANMKVGQNFHVTQTDASVFLARITAISALNVTIATALPVGAASGAAANAQNYEHYQYPEQVANKYDLNTVIGQSNTNANAGYFQLWPGLGAITPTDTRSDGTTYVNNTHMTVAAAATAGYDIDRCMAKYLTSIGFPLTSTVQLDVINQLSTYLKANMRKGYYDTNLIGKAVANYVRTGVGMAASP